MKNLFQLVVIVLILNTSLNAQSSVIINGNWPNVYLLHKVVAKENLYVIGRNYNSSPSVHIAPANKMKITDVLSDGKILQVPLNAINFTQNKTIVDTMALVPVIYLVRKGENLSVISTKFNNLSINTIKDWNKITSDGIVENQRLVIGYLVVNPKLSKLSWVRPSLSNAVVTPIKTTTTATNNTTAKPPVVTPPTPTIKEDKPANVTTTVKPTKPNNGDAYFASAYKGIGNVTKTLNAAFFETNASAENKFYVLINLIQPGTILKLTNGATGKISYAQVLNGLDNANYNRGIQMRMSNTLKTALGINSEAEIASITINY
jgi:LysM repeat protein